LVPTLSGISTEMSSLRNPLSSSMSTACSACARSRYSPNTAVFFPAIFLSLARLLLFRFDRQLVRDVAGPGDLRRLLLDRLLLFCRAHRSLQRHFAVLRNDLHVVRIRRQ